MAETEDFIGLTYRGQPLAERVRIFDFGPTTAYVETAEPMPVGTALVATSDSSLEIQLEVASVREQASGAPGPVGMRVRAVSLNGEAARWWSERESTDDPAPAEVEGEVVRAGDGPHRGDGTVELEDDGKTTQAIRVRRDGNGEAAEDGAPRDDEATEASAEAPGDDEPTEVSAAALDDDQPPAMAAEAAGEPEPASDDGDAESNVVEGKRSKRRRSKRKTGEPGDGGESADGATKKKRGRRKKKP